MQKQLVKNKSLLLFSERVEECPVCWSVASSLFLTLKYDVRLTALLLSFQALLWLSCCPLEHILHRAVATQQSFLGNGKSIRCSLSFSFQSPLIHYTALLSYGHQSCSLPYSKSRYAETWDCSSLSVQFHLSDKCNCITSTAALMCPNFHLLFCNFVFCY